ncbi:unnamed protein product [Rotaria sordida]|uniref:Proteasome component Ecm29 N-terminal domain-containing protein n=1 Tax=Rotaria sordida TaxID=392033 RepID=A0A815UZU4_9BILA|nr:unnamed protein product [Rotaria sordida]
MYIKMGFMRLKPDHQVELVPLLFQSLTNRSISHQELLMGLIVYALQHIKIIPNMNENIIKYGLTEANGEHCIDVVNISKRLWTGI